MNLKQKLLGAAAVFVMLSVTDANAQADFLDVRAEVPEVCVITSPINISLDFGLLDVLSADSTASATIDWRCSLGTIVTIALGVGAGPSANTTTRVMQGANTGNPLPYRLLHPVTGGAWGNTGAELFTTTALGLLSPESTLIDGIIALADAEVAAVDVYTDLVTITFLP